MSLYQDEYGFEKNPSPVSPVMTEIVGGALDAYYSRIHHMQQEIDALRNAELSERINRESAETKAEENWASREEQAKRADNAEGKARVLQAQLEAKATEAAKQEKVIEQYAAWRVAVREALKDLPSGTDIAVLVETSSSAARDIMTVVQRIDDLTKRNESEA